MGIPITWTDGRTDVPHDDNNHPPKFGWGLKKRKTSGAFHEFKAIAIYAYHKLRWFRGREGVHTDKICLLINVENIP